MTGDHDFRRILGYAWLNLLGNAAPLVTAAIAFPILVNRLGEAGFGLFSLIWVVLGYFSIFDLGLSRTLTRLIAERLAAGREAEISDLVTTVIGILAGLGLFGGAACAGLALLRIRVAGLPAGLEGDDATWICIALLLGVPATLLVAGIRGILEGYQDFRRANALRVPSGIALIGLPCVFAMVEARVMAAVIGLLAARLLILFMHVASTRAHLAHLRGRLTPHLVGPLFRFGGWLTVSNVVGPLIVYVDRFVLAAWLGPRMVGFYTAPFEIVARLLIIPQALANALFPKLTATHVNDQEGFHRLYRRGVWLCLLVVVPVAATGALAAPWILARWLGAGFAAESTQAMQTLLLGFIFNALAHLPLTALHGQGRARPVAMLHLAEFPAYMAILILLVSRLGIEGAALAWAIRSAVDCCCLFWLVRAPVAGRLEPRSPLIPGLGKE